MTSICRGLVPIIVGGAHQLPYVLRNPFLRSIPMAISRSLCGKVRFYTRLKGIMPPFKSNYISPNVSLDISYASRPFNRQIAVKKVSSMNDGPLAIPLEPYSWRDANSDVVLCGQHVLKAIISRMSIQKENVAFRSQRVNMYQTNKENEGRNKNKVS